MLLIYAPALPELVIACSICAALILGGLALLWLLEFLGRNHLFPISAGADIGMGNKALDECYRRLFAKSRLTRWVEMALRFLYAGGTNWWRWLAARYRGQSNYNVGYEEVRIQVATSANGEYTDDADEDIQGDLLLDSDNE
jgi:hypothetical protein